MEIKKGKAGRKHQYELAFKRKVCEELLSGQISIGDIARKYNIPGAGTIMRWVRWFQKEQEYLISLQNMNDSPTHSEHNTNKSDQDLSTEIQTAKIKIATLETMIDIAEKQFNIDIRKKSGTKPSIE
jgi:transposase-like protein